MVVDRGDVWYDPWFDDKDKWRYPTRQRLTLPSRGRRGLELQVAAKCVSVRS